MLSKPAAMRGTVLVLVLVLLMAPGGAAPSNAPEALKRCLANLGNIGVALEMWASDHQGRYPSRLGEVTPMYLKRILPCPAAGSDTYTAGYRNQGAKWFVMCKGFHHGALNVPVNHPQYLYADEILVDFKQTLKPWEAANDIWRRFPPGWGKDPKNRGR